MQRRRWLRAECWQEARTTWVSTSPSVAVSAGEMRTIVRLKGHSEYGLADLRRAPKPSRPERTKMLRGVSDHARGRSILSRHGLSDSVQTISCGSFHLRFEGREARWLSAANRPHLSQHRTGNRCAPWSSAHLFRRHRSPRWYPPEPGCRRRAVGRGRGSAIARPDARLTCSRSTC